MAPPERCTAFGIEGERLVARLVSGWTTRPNHPVDVITPTLAIEVKSLDPGAGIWRTYMRRRELVRKNRFARENKLEPWTYLVIIHPDQYQVYRAIGFRCLDADGMEYVGAYPR